MGVFTPVLITLGYVVSRDKSQTLMIHRNTRPDDLDFGKYTGVGGKLEAGEDIVTGMCREIKEESGLIVDRLVLRGTVALPGFGKRNEGGFITIFRIDKWHGELNIETSEGTLEWVPIRSLLTLPLWKSDYQFVPMVFDDDPRQFHGCIPCYNGEMGEWSHVRV
ncbi:MAG: 8-oxo-dGTP diphosphatase [Chloroflexi bacterium]|nr:8-oxo-dGTP diphosphatase [Chloroflexota bacterium]